MTAKGYYLRLSLYALVAALTTLILDLKALVGAEPINTLQWSIIFIQSFLAGALTVRAFIDKSPAQLDES